ncbi:5-formyltetrahydrofolate cyclo-ligase [Polynucleobacter sp. 86C-FISCH]|uniref:5-formyltetrahydrofolate cyclo-ligase n=1 Tax=Polynucleobacter sp. 86C-FISCH TaxID=2689101 RepID=UPI001C0DD3F1|nr:5-formyltetrahydrofolate cyclo-ligase [Polynucleobacter sp. 86C-FISCH]MBU3595600.1 5-formyltetrahydrofolate cyclo-ligase [Polynucleobacter sp. 86C-FISCH]
MIDMHGNSAKTLRQNLLNQRTMFAAEHDYAQIQARLIDHLNELLSEQGDSWQSIALYWPIQDEIDLRSALVAWAKKAPNRTLSLPFARPDKHLDFYEWRQGDQLIQSKHGVPEPNPENPARPQLTPDCILIPCVGWSCSVVNGKTHYWRLGYGGGYFDRTLAQLRKNNPNLICMGIGFNWQKLDDSQWAAQTHDEPLDMLLTESGLLR